MAFRQRHQMYAPTSSDHSLVTTYHVSHHSRRLCACGAAGEFEMRMNSSHFDVVSIGTFLRPYTVLLLLR